MPPKKRSAPAAPPKGEDTSATAKDEMVRLTFDVTKDLHRRIKVACAVKGVRMADEVRVILEEHFPEEKRKR